jgi:hypothetical protein
MRAAAPADDVPIRDCEVRVRVARKYIEMADYTY